MKKIHLGFGLTYTTSKIAVEKAFPDLAIFTLQVLSLPLANATVERVFSVMNAVKN